tara:strand:+ start:34164 stop:35180 length:1017 start_codon:yes stop_codon:yes gene_type:complete
MSFDCDEAWENFCTNVDKSNINSIIEREEITNVQPIIPKCSDIYISTTTKISYFNNNVDLFTTFWQIPIIPYSTQSCGCVKKQIKYTICDAETLKNIESKLEKYQVYNMQQISYVNNPEKNLFKDIRKINIGLSEKDITSLRSKKKGAFYNCYVLIIRLFDNIQNKYRETHVKIFNTGKLELPGIKCKYFYKTVLNYLINLFSEHCNVNYTLSDKHETVLINSNFSCGYCINREKMARILQKKYKFETAYDPCSYPGIMSKWFVPDSKNKISFMIFRTGSVLIVGKCCENDIYNLYNILKTIFLDEYSQIVVSDSYILKPKPDSKIKYRRKYIDVRIQ